MLTPLFNINQTDKSIIIYIKAHLAKLSSTEIDVCDKELFFSSKPYFLRLFLPCSLAEDDQHHATYDSDSGTFVVTADKKKFGEHFPGLEFITKLLTPPGRLNAKPLIEEIDDSLNDNGENIDEHAEILFEQKVALEMPTTSKFGYGFGNLRTNIFTILKEEIAYMFDVTDPDNMSMDERRKFARENEREKFNDDHYLADFYANDEIEPLLNFDPWWKIQLSLNELKLTNEEIDRLKEFPKKTYSHLSETSEICAKLSLIDILYAYAYNNRTTCGENTSESGWLILKLSSTLSCFVCWENLEQCVESCFRRSLTFPLYRRWDLSKKVFEDVKILLKSGNVAVLKCLIEIHKNFANAGEYRYILNDLYITDYCVWLQYQKVDSFDDLIDQLSKINVEKDGVALELNELEMAAMLAMEENEVDDNLDSTIQKLQATSLADKSKMDSDDSESDDE